VAAGDAAGTAVSALGERPVAGGTVWVGSAAGAVMAGLEVVSDDPGVLEAVAPADLLDDPSRTEDALSVDASGERTWLVLRAGAPGPAREPPPQWCIAMPDVFSIRNTTVEAYVEPVVHEIKVRRADLLGDLKKPAKRTAYLDLGGACWYVLGNDARGRPVGQPDEIPPECGVMWLQDGQLSVARPAPRRPVERLPLAVWMALAQSTPCRFDDGAQVPLTPCDAS